MDLMQNTPWRYHVVIFKSFKVKGIKYYILLILQNQVFFDPKTCKWRIAYLTYYDKPAWSTYQDLLKLKQ